MLLRLASLNGSQRPFASVPTYPSLSGQRSQSSKALAVTEWQAPAMQTESVRVHALMRVWS